jgi:hypothetical protein
MATCIEMATARADGRVSASGVDPAALTGASSIYVVATTLEGTRAAIAAASAVAEGSGTGAVLFVPWVVPYVEPLDRPSDSVAFGVRNFRRLAEESGIPVTVRVCLCRSSSAAIAAMLPGDSVVVVGGPSRQWWPSREQRLAARLSRSGRRVLFVAEARDGSPVTADGPARRAAGERAPGWKEAWRG